MRPSPETPPTSTGPSDAALVVAARAGERWAQEALFRRYARMVNGLAYRVMGRDDEIDDLVQDAFLAAFQSLDRLQNPAVFKSWLGSIVVRQAHKRLRRRSLLSRLGLRNAGATDPDTVAPAIANADVQRELSVLYRAMERMKPDVRTALTLHRVEGMGIQEVAEHMGVSPATVKRRLADARRQLERLAPGGVP